MKKIFFIVALFATVLAQNCIAQDSAQSPLLTSYYSIKDAMISGNADAVSSGAKAFIQAAGNTGSKFLPAESRGALLKDAERIAKSKDIKQQREAFAGFSTSMLALTKAVKLTKDPVHQQYCPMKKASWLSSSKAIKNPYFGSTMLTCGKVTETL